jgi:hypothetical protein
MQRRLTSTEARAKIRECLESGTVTYRSHAVDQMFARKVPTSQVEHVLRAGVVTGPELVNNEWRHRVTAQRVAVVVAIYHNVAIVTIMRTS